MRSIAEAHVNRNAEAHDKKTIKDAVITVPAYFNIPQKQATKDAAKIAGLNVLRIINEPTAAALAHSCSMGKVEGTKNILVFDFGGGTFDVTIFALSDGVLDVLATRGDMFLGGRNIDEAFIDNIAD